jgi:chemotaxis signal transduction protein
MRAIDDLRDNRLIHFRIGEHGFALPLEAAREVVSEDQKSSVSAEGEPSAFDYRGRSTPFLDLLGHLGLPIPDDQVRRKIIVLVIGGNTYGIKVSSVNDILKGTDVVRHNAIINLDEKQKKIISGLVEVRKTSENLLLLAIEGFEDLGLLTVNHDQAPAESRSASENGYATNKQLCLHFESARHHWFLPIELVERILPRLELSPYPSAAPFVIGIRQIDGEVLPVIDCESRLTDEPPKKNYRRILVLRQDSSLYALGVERVCDIIDLTSWKKNIEPLDPSTAGPIQKYSKSEFTSGRDFSVHELNLAEVCRRGALDHAS